jgi:hypothetical protein
MKIFDTMVKLAIKRGLTLAQPCWALGISIDELERRVEARDTAALDACCQWLGVTLGEMALLLEKD